MQFFDRENEMDKLRSISSLSSGTSHLTVVTGRRRIGKTSLLIKAYDEETMLYFFVSRDSESSLCEEFAEEVKSKLNIPIVGRVEHFADLFSFLMEVSEKRPLTLVIDEFQNFMRVNGSIFSQMQRIWDLHKSTAKMNLIVCGSVNSMMNRLFRDHKEPLYGRQTDIMNVEAFTPNVIKQILGIYNPQSSREDLLSLYLLTGGVAKYVEIFMDNHITTRSTMLDYVLSKDSYFIYEGKNMLIEEFGRDYGRYFEILKLIAMGRNTRAEIEDTLKMEVSGYLTRLENDYALISKRIPLLQKSSNKNIHYAIDDNFLCFWFRFLYKYAYMIEVNAYGKLLEVVERDYTTFSGKVLEKYFIQQMKELGRYTNIGSWWDRKGENEIDIIAIDEIKKTIDFFEVKRNKNEVDISVLKKKAEVFLTKNGEIAGYKQSYKGLSLEDM